MAKNSFKNFSYLLITVFLTLGLSISFQSLLAAWTAPLANPPTCAAGNPGCDEPVNKGHNLQIKGGPLYVNADNIAATGFVAYGKVGIGTTLPYAMLSVVGNSNEPQLSVFAASSQTAANSIIQIQQANGLPIFGIYADSFSNLFMGLDVGKNTTPVVHGPPVFNTTGSENIAFGYKALYSNTDGWSNIALGNSSLYSNTTGAHNIALGNSALYSNTDGWSNIALGNSSLYSNTTGAHNIAFGDYSLISNTTGNYNTALGYNASFINATGNYNVAVGVDSLYGNNGNSNTAVGTDSLIANTTGYQNTANGMSSLSSNITGSNNTAIGYNTGVGITTGSNNTILGANVTGLAANLSNNIIIADGAGNQRINVGATGKVGIGLTSPSAKLSVAGSGLTTGKAFAITDSANAEKFTVLDNGNVGIGVTPETLLDVSGFTANELTARFYDRSSSNRTMVQIRSGSAQGGNDVFQVIKNDASTNLFKVANNGNGFLAGNLFLGTAPDNRFIAVNSFADVGGSPSSDGGGFKFGKGGTYSAITAGGGGYLGNERIINFFTGDDMVTEKMIIRASGNVGIGTTNPTEKVSIVDGTKTLNIGASAYTGNMAIYPSAAGETLNLGDGNNDLNFSIINGNGDSILYVSTAAENVGIGLTNPTYKLQVNGNAANTTGAWAVASDARLKEAIQPLDGSLDELIRLQGVSFYWKDKSRGQDRQRGFIAQDVEKVIPEWVRTDQNGYKWLEKQGIEAIIVEAIKELAAALDNLAVKVEGLFNKYLLHEARIQSLEKANQEQQKQIDDLRNQIEAIKNNQ